MQTAVGAGEEAVLATERQGEVGALDDVVVELDALSSRKPVWPVLRERVWPRGPSTYSTGLKPTRCAIGRSILCSGA